MPGQNLTRKLIASHLVHGTMEVGQEIALRVDQTLTQDALGTACFLEFEAFGIPRIRNRLAVSYVDHQMAQVDNRNAEDHVYLQDVAAKHGVHFSRPGNGICHQVHLERFSTPGEVLVGTDSHTPTCGAMGMLAIGAGGLDVACIMGGLPFYLTMPKIVKVDLRGKLGPWVSSKDIILHLLGQLSVKGGVGRIFEYVGPGAATLEVPARSTITNMGAEMGATTSLFATDARSRWYLEAQGRGPAFSHQQPDSDADYDEVIPVDLAALEPLIALPHMPDRVVPVREVAGTPVDQVNVGSCTNSSFQDLMTVARILKGKTIHPRVSFTVSPGSKQVFEMISRNGALADLVAAGARILESACGPCPGLAAVPHTGAVSVRSFNRNFDGRCGAPGINVYLASPAVCAAIGLAGEIVDPRGLYEPIKVRLPNRYHLDDRGILPPAESPDQVEIRRGDNIKPIPTRGPLEPALQGEVLLKLRDNITTDTILPAHANILAYRSNVPAIAEFTFTFVDPSFAARAREKGGGFVLAGQNYGQGSSREHAALAPMYLGVKAVIAQSFARIHMANLANWGIAPLILENADDYATIDQGDQLEVPNLATDLAAGATRFEIRNQTKGSIVPAHLDLGARPRQILLAGGLLNFVRHEALAEVK
jgi:predicted aconitate hydratase